MDTRYSVLIADSNEDFTEHLKEAVQNGGYDIAGTASDGVRAVELLEQLHPDILILDLALSRLDGLGVLQRLPETGHKPAVIMLSGFYNDTIVTVEKKK